MNDVNNAFDAVKQFHAANGFPINQPFPTSGDLTTLFRSKLEGMADDLEAISTELVQIACSTELHWGPVSQLVSMRLHLPSEEVGEMFVAASEGDKLKFFDGLCDSLYVLYGAAVVYDLPVMRGFTEVHRSNMTKTKQVDDEHGARLRKKGPYFIPPDLGSIIEGRRTSLEALARYAEHSASTILEVLKEGKEALDGILVESLGHEDQALIYAAFTTIQKA